VVDRTIDGTDYTFIEQFQPLDWGPDPNYCWFVDCGGVGLAYSGTEEVPGANEVAATYQFTYLGENGGIWGVPIGDVGYYTSFNVGGEANDIGGGIVGIPYTNNPFQAGWQIVINGTTNYDGTYVTLPAQGPNELRLTTAYGAETFDGTEFAGQLIDIPASFGRMAIDQDDYLWFGHTWDGNTAVGRIDANDHSISYDELTWESGIAGGAGTMGIRAQGGDSLFVLYGGNVRRFAMPAGTITWRTAVGKWDMDVDDANNAYTLDAYGGAVQLAAADGSITTYTDCGKLEAPVWFGGGVAVHYAEDLDLVVVGGSSVIPDAYDWENNAFNLWVRTPDDSAGDRIRIGTMWTTYVYPALLRYVPALNIGHITSDENYIYAMIVENDLTSTLHRISWDGASLTVEQSVTATSVVRGGGMWMDLWGNLVVANLAGFGEDRLYFYDPNDLSEIGGIDDIPAAMAQSWNGIGAVFMQGWGDADGHIGIPSQGEVIEVPGEWTIGDANQLKDAYLCLYADGIPRGSFYATDDVVSDWNDTYSVVIAGINYYSIYETFPLDRYVQNIGRIKTQKASIQNMRIDFWETMGCNLGASLDDYAPIQFSEDDFLTAIPPYSGPKVMTFPRGINREPVIYMWVWEPIPMGIRGIYSNMEVEFPWKVEQ
jgi:hypothetical protein